MECVCGWCNDRFNNTVKNTGTLTHLWYSFLLLHRQKPRSSDTLNTCSWFSEEICLSRNKSKTVPEHFAYLIHWNPFYFFSVFGVLWPRWTAHSTSMVSCQKGPTCHLPCLRTAGYHRHMVSSFSGKPGSQFDIMQFMSWNGTMSSPCPRDDGTWLAPVTFTDSVRSHDKWGHVLVGVIDDTVVVSDVSLKYWALGEENHDMSLM